MNKIILSGRISNDIKIETGNKDNLEFVKFSIAVPKKKSNSDLVDFIPIIAFNKIAQYLSKYCSKGTKILLEGSLNTNIFVNKEGTRVKTYEVIANSVEKITDAKTSDEKSNNASDNVKLDNKKNIDYIDDQQWVEIDD